MGTYLLNISKRYLRSVAEAGSGNEKVVGDPGVMRCPGVPGKEAVAVHFTGESFHAVSVVVFSGCFAGKS